VLTADFNFRPEDPLYARIQSPIGDGVPAYRDSWAIAHPGTPHAPTPRVYDKVQWPDEAYCCDFIFVNTDLAARVQAVAVNGTTERLGPPAGAAHPALVVAGCRNPISASSTSSGFFGHKRVAAACHLDHPGAPDCPCSSRPERAGVITSRLPRTSRAGQATCAARSMPAA